MHLSPDIFSNPIFLGGCLLKVSVHENGKKKNRTTNQVQIDCPHPKRVPFPCDCSSMLCKWFYVRWHPILLCRDDESTITL